MSDEPRTSFATEFTILHFGLTGKQAEDLLTELADQAYEFAMKNGLDTPALMSRTFGTEEYWEEVSDCEAHDACGGHRKKEES